MHRLISLLLVLILSTATLPAAAAQESGTPTASAGQTVIVGGLNNPRGFTWGADGTLYIAEAGRGGDTPIPLEPGFTATHGLTSSIVAVADGCPTTLVQGLLSAKWVEANWVWGAMDVAILNGDLYALLSGAGPSFLSPSTRSGVYKVNADGTMTLVADLTSWLPAHLPSSIPPDYNSDGSLFDLEATGDALLLTEAVGGLVIKVTPQGEISTLADLSRGHPVPTGLAVDADGNAYVGFLTPAPYADGSSKVVKITPAGAVSDVWTGLTRVTDVEIGPDGKLYAAELATGNTESEIDVSPNSGRIVRQSGPDSSDVIASGLNAPVGLGFGPDGALYVSGPGNGADHGEGWLARVDVAGTGDATPMAAECEAIGTPVA